ACVLGAEAAELFLDGGEAPVAGEGLVALGLEGGLPGAEERFADVEGPGGLRDGVALLGGELDRLDLELAGVAASVPGHGGPPEGKFTALTWCPPFLGRFSWASGRPKCQTSVK